MGFTSIQITIVSFLVSDSIPFTSVELLQIEPIDMTVDGAEDRVQFIGKKQGAKGPVSYHIRDASNLNIKLVYCIPYPHSSIPYCHTPIP